MIWNDPQPRQAPPVGLGVDSKWLAELDQHDQPGGQPAIYHFQRLPCKINLFGMDYIQPAIAAAQKKCTRAAKSGVWEIENLSSRPVDFGRYVGCA